MYKSLFHLTFLLCPSVLDMWMDEAEKEYYTGLICHTLNEKKTIWQIKNKSNDWISWFV